MKEVEKRCLRNLFDVLEVKGLGHTGGSLSVLQILVSLYFEVARTNPVEPRWTSRDRIILSKAHACEAMYAVLAEKGFFPKEMFSEYLEFGSMLQGHSEISTPGVEYSGGSLGQGLSFASGVAYSARLSDSSYSVYCILGDGECHEGSVWEAAMFASHYKLDNLFAIVDYNHFADHDDVDHLMNLQPLTDKWASFGWEVKYLEKGNDVDAITKSLKGFKEAGKPKCLIADTVKNYGVPIWTEKHLHQAAGDELIDGLVEGRRLVDGEV